MAGEAPIAAAFEITKGERQVKLLSEAEVERHLDLRQLLDGLEEGFRQVERGRVQTPARPEIGVPGKGFSLAMCAWQPGMQICVKVVSVFDGNLAFGMPNHLALINLFDPETGAATCVMDGTYITGVRTAAAAALSVRLLSRADARVATIVGAGVQAREHLRVLPLVRPFEHINICSLDYEHARRLAAHSDIARPSRDLEAAVRDSDVVCLATNSPTPVIDPAWVKPGTHVSSVGYSPPGGELPSELARETLVFVESTDALQPPPVGCAELAGLDASRCTTLGAVALDHRKGRTDETAITVYKAMGIAMEDMVAANVAFEGALRADAGQVMTW